MRTKYLTATEARKKANKQQLPQILENIEVNANMGYNMTTFSVDLSTKTIKSLKRLGYKIDVEHGTINW